MRYIPCSPHRIVSAEELLLLANADENNRREKIEQIIHALECDEKRISASIVSVIFRGLEAFVFLAASAVVYALYLADYSAATLTIYAPLALGATLAFTLLTNAARLYTIQALLQPIRSAPRLTASLLGVFAAIFAIVFFSKLGESYSRIWLGSWMLASLCGVLLFRGLASNFIGNWTRSGRLNRRAVVVGGGEQASQLIEMLDNNAANDLSIVGIFDDRDDERSPTIVRGCPKLGKIADLEEFARRVDVDILLITIPTQAEDRLLELAKRLSILPVDIRLSAVSQKFRYQPRTYSYIGNVAFLDILDRPLGDWDLALKSWADRILAGCMLAVASPFMLLVALAIKIESRGPVLFCQKRYGFKNELIEVYKFRSMFLDDCDLEASKLVTKNDPRVTRVGSIIRKTSIDELPQLINVLQGRLSLVGPRPHAAKARADKSLYQEVVESYFARHKVKPGITGWAQVNGWRGETDTVEKIQKRVEHDLYYIENWSLLLDLYILVRTPFALFNTEQAY